MEGRDSIVEYALVTIRLIATKPRENITSQSQKGRIRTGSEKSYQTM